MIVCTTKTAKYLVRFSPLLMELSAQIFWHGDIVEPDAIATIKVFLLFSLCLPHVLSHHTLNNFQRLLQLIAVVRNKRFFASAGVLISTKGVLAS